MMGDLEERFQLKIRERHAAGARIWFWFQILHLVLYLVKDHVLWSGIMFKNYLRIAIRNIKRDKTYSFINIVGLAAGMACCLLILLWVNDEILTDRYHTKLESLYQVHTIQPYGDEVSHNAGSVPALAPALKAEYPGVLNVARVLGQRSVLLLTYGNRQFREVITLADPEIFQMFTFPFVQGHPEDAFGDRYVLVLSETIAKKIFDGEKAVGKILTVNNNEEFLVVGVMKNIPPQSVRPSGRHAAR